jgi:hypothetical protein
MHSTVQNLLVLVKGKGYNARKINTRLFPYVEPCIIVFEKTSLFYASNVDILANHMGYMVGSNFRMQV